MKIKTQKSELKKTKLIVYGGNHHIRVRGQGTNPNPNVMAATIWGQGLNLVIKGAQTPSLSPFCSYSLLHIQILVFLCFQTFLFLKFSFMFCVIFSSSFGFLLCFARFVVCNFYVLWIFFLACSILPLYFCRQFLEL